MENKPKASSFVESVKRLALPVATAVALILSLLGFLEYDLAEPLGSQPEAATRGVTNFDSVTLSDDLVADSVTTTDLDVSNAPTFGSGNLYPLLINDSSEALYVGSATITGTLVMTSSTHGLTTPTAAFCSLGVSPGTGAGDPALCWVAVSGETITVTVEQDDWTTNATVGGVVNYAVVGTP